MDSGRTMYYDYCISVSSYYQLTLEEIDDVLIHEMIHYTIAYTGLKDTSNQELSYTSDRDERWQVFPFLRQPLFRKEIVALSCSHA